MNKISRASQFKKDWKRVKTSITEEQENELKKVLQNLKSGKGLPKKYQDHHLQGNWNNYRDCHISPDLILIYQIREKVPDVLLARIGSHSDLFN